MNLSHLFSRNSSGDDENIKVISKAKDISMTKFIEISVDGNLELLSIGSVPAPMDMLVLAWDAIYEEYLNTLMPDFKKNIQNKIDIERLRSKTMIIELMVNYLRVMYDEEMVESLRENGFDYKYDPDDTEGYHKDLSRVITGCKFWVMEIIEFDKENEVDTNTKQKKMTYEFFYKAIFDLSRYAQHDIDPDKINALAFATRYSSMIKYYSKINSKSK